MKKKLLMLIPLLGVTGLSSCSYNVQLDNLIDEPILDGRSVDENWREYDCWIGFDSQNDQKRYYTAEPGDYITHIAFVKGFWLRKLEITYAANFYLWDDLEAQFFFDNGFATHVETTHSPIAAETLIISNQDAEKYNLKEAHITKLRVRTVD